MLFARSHRRFTTWLALLVMVMAALVPTLAQAAVASSERNAWVEVCAASGMVWVKVDSGDALQAGPEGHAPMNDASQHCPWCSLHGGAAGLPAADDAVPTPQRRADLPPGFYRTVAPTLAWAPPQARAPPTAA